MPKGTSHWLCLLIDGFVGGQCLLETFICQDDMICVGLLPPRPITSSISGLASWRLGFTAAWLCSGFGFIIAALWVPTPRARARHWPGARPGGAYKMQHHHMTMT